ncbi:unnamed protein product [Protopolystoma xenopodis]|uniref:Uncharacterized protein n=1 Tax=Protopolystoma xenopodis TaxID=117903 RepID=A0A3S5AZN5_9PLAT|nr:unnamed protein product [Protopolystoma xenopodis]
MLATVLRVADETNCRHSPHPSSIESPSEDKELASYAWWTCVPIGCSGEEIGRSGSEEDCGLSPGRLNDETECVCVSAYVRARSCLSCPASTCVYGEWATLTSGVYALQHKREEDSQNLSSRDGFALAPGHWYFCSDALTFVQDRRKVAHPSQPCVVSSVDHRGELGGKERAQSQHRRIVDISEATVYHLSPMA